MSNDDINKIEAYKNTTISVLEQQIEILKGLDSVLRIEAELRQENSSDDTEQKQQILTPEKIVESQEILNNEITKLKKFNVVLAVVGTMKAGKSTTINAIVGREILPNRNHPMTALPTLICHNPDFETPRLYIDITHINQFLEQLKEQLKDFDKSEEIPEDILKLIKFINNGGHFKEKYEGEQEIFEFLFQVNDLVRLPKYIANDDLIFPFDNYKNFSNLPRIEVAFNLKEQFNTQGKFMLLDTAGPNEAGQDQLREALAEQLQRSSAVMIILDYTQLGSNAEQDVKDQVEKIPSVQKNRLFAIINKYDNNNANSDDAEKTTDRVFNGILKDRVKEDNIYVISAQCCYLANRMLTYVDKNKDKPPYKADTWVADFAKKSYGSRPEQDYNRATIDEIQQKIQYLFEDGRMQVPMERVILNMQKNAPTIAIQSAIAGAGAVFNNLYNALNIREELTGQGAKLQEEINKQQKMIEAIKQELQDLEDRKNDFEEKKEGFKQEIRKKIELDEFINKVEEESNKYIEYLFVELQTEVTNKVESDKPSNIKFFFLKKSYEKYLKAINSAKSRIELIKKGQFAFDNKKEVEEFLEDVLDKLYECLKESIDNSQKKIVNNTIDVVKKEITIFEQETKVLLEIIRDQLEKSDIKPRFNFDIKNNSYQKEISLSKIKFKHNAKNVKTLKNTIKLFAGFKRFIGNIIGKINWGKEESEDTIYYVDYQTDIYAVFKKQMDEEITPALEKTLSEIVDDIIKMSVQDIDDFAQEIGAILGEMEQSHKTQELLALQNKEAQQNYQNKISELKEQIDNSLEDWEGVIKEFDVENNFVTYNQS